MAFKPNEEQLEFLNSKNCNVLVSASAGSGKTSTMIQKLMQIIIDDQVPIQNLLVLTFTEAAATEIKQKLFTEITSRIQTENDAIQEYLKKQLDNINSAEIGTLHSVCKKLIIKYFYELNLSPDFSMLSEKESKYLLDFAISSVFEKHIVEQDNEFFELYECYSAKRNETNLKNMIFNIINYLRNKVDAPKWIEEKLSTSFESDLNKNPVCDYLCKYSVSQIKSYKKETQELLSSAESEYQKYLEFLNTRLRQIEELSEVSNFVQLQKILFALPSTKKPSKSSKSSEFELEFDDLVDDLNKRFLETIKQLKLLIISGEEKSVVDNLNHSKKNLVKLIDITFETINKYTELKKSKNSLDFNDLEDTMLLLLENEKIRKILQNTYQFVFFDEYQDINEKQETILSKIVTEDNYYMIGDVKQSIYAFRQSSPQIFVNKFFQFQNDNVLSKVINFNKNYRSDRNILSFDNMVFDKLITTDTIGIDYSLNSRFETNNPFVKCNVDVQIIDKTKEKDEESLDSEKKEAIVIANTIAKLLVTKKQDGSYFTYKDIAIILRKRGSFIKTLVDTLSTMQIPISAVLSSDFFDTYEINLMCSIVKVISNYKDDINLAIVLKNLFELSDEELYVLKSSKSDSNLFECIKEYNENLDICKKINSFFEFLQTTHLYLTQHTIEETIQMILEKFDLIIRFKSMPNGFEKVNNINEFLSIASNENYKFNIDKFVEYLDFISKDSQLQKVGSSGNSVQIMTIHYSKGLEFPAVILAGLGKKFTINKDTSDVIINEKFGLGLKCINSQERFLEETIIRNACKLDNKKSELNEEIRLLYVAMTRPKEYLCLVGEYDLINYKRQKAKDIYSSNNYFDLIFKSMPNVYDSNFENKKDVVINDNQDNCANIIFINEDEIIGEDEKSNKIILTKSTPALVSIIKERLQTTPSKETFTIKNTVTNILKEETNYENINYYPEKLDASDKLENRDSLKIGTAYHSVMQNLNFNETKSEIEDLIVKLTKENIIDKEIATNIKIDEIWQAKEVLKDLILSADQVYKEKQFVMQQNYNKIVKNSDNNTKVIVQGIIDLVVVKNGKSYLIDYKTNRTNDEQKLISSYALQLQIYSQAFEKATNIAITHKYLYSFSMGKLIEVK